MKKRNNLMCFCALAVVLMLSGCGIISFKASTNIRSNDSSSANQNSQASFNLRDERKLADGTICNNPKKHGDILVLLALSGGGSRAALLSGLSMVEMQKTLKLDGGSNLLSEVDLISSVSGGSLAAAYYASSKDPADTSSMDSNEKPECRKAGSGKVWNETEVTDLMSKDYLTRWIWNWFWPDNIVLYWFSTYDRTDMMAQTFADNLYDTKYAGVDLRFKDLNPMRPNLIINATQGSINATEDHKKSNGFGQPFTFTKEDFSRVCSSIDDYELSRGVMASAAFPGVFNFMTLKNHCADSSYVHLFDGGNADNLGLTSIKREIWNLHKTNKLSDYKKIIVILVDAYTDSSGASEKVNDPRHFMDYFVDTNFITATDSLLAKNRDNLLTQYESGELFPYNINNAGNLTKINLMALNVRQKNAELIKEDAKKEITTACTKFFSWESPEEVQKTCSSYGEFDHLNDEVSARMEFVHISFDEITDPDLKRQLNNIATSFKFSSAKDAITTLSDKDAIVCAVPTLFGRDQECVRDGKPYKYTASEKLTSKWRKIQEIFNSPTH